MAENESRKQARQPGDIPRSVRQRTGSSSSSSEDEASAVDEAKDKAWHETKGVPYVPIGSPFEYAGISFLRTGARAAKCTQPGCSTTFNTRTYHTRGLGLHATKCLEKLAKKQQQEVAWDGVVTTSHTFEGGKTVSVEFEKIFGTGASRWVKCKECNKVLQFAAESVRETHVKQKHKPEPTLEDKLKDELGVKGKNMWSGFFGKAKKRGSEAKKEREERNKELDEAKQAGVEPPPPPPPPPLARTARPPPPPPLPRAALPVVQQRSDDFLETIDGALQSQQRLIDRYARRLAQAGVANDSDDNLDDDVDATRCPRVCRGFSLKLGQRVGASYPYGLDDTSPAWTLPDDQGRVRACGERPCEGIVTDGNESCGACERLKGDQRLVRLQQRALDPELHRSRTNNKFLTFDQLASRVEHHRKTASESYFTLAKTSREARRLQVTASAFSRVTAALATQKLPRVHVAIKRLLDRGATATAIAKQMERCVDGYVPRGEFTETDYQKAWLSLKLGGQRMLRLQMVDDGACSKSQLYRQTILDVPRHVPCRGTLLVNSLRYNLDQCFGKPPPDGKMALHHALIDNINLDERLTYQFGAPELGGVLMARESTFQGDPTITRVEDLARLQRAFDDGEILVPKEATVVAIVRNAPTAPIFSVFSSGTAKLKGYELSAADLSWMAEKTKEIWQAEYAPKHGPLASVATDADSLNVKSQSLAGLQDEMVQGQQRKLLAKLALVDLKADKNGTCACADEQHAGKCGRGCFCRAAGFVVDVIRFYRDSTIEIIHVYVGIPIVTLQSYLPPPGVDDHQNVPSMVMLFEALASLLDKKAGDFAVDVRDQRKPAYARQLREIRPLAHLAKCIVFSLTNQKATLSEHVANWAELVVTLFVLKRHNKGVLPAQTARAIGQAVTSHIKCIALAQINRIEWFFPFIDATHLLEQVFGIHRTLCGSQRNLDMKQLGERTSTATGIQRIYQEHPEWREKSRRLGDSKDHWNTRSWTGCVNPMNVNLEAAWRAGMLKGIKALRKTEIFSADELNIQAILKKDPSVSVVDWNGSGDVEMEEADGA